MIYDDSFILTESMHIKARTYYTDWSALSEAVITIPLSYSGLAVSELHYHPLVQDTTDNDKLYEFIELTNIGDESIDLSNVFFADGIDFQFPEAAVLDPGNYIVLASDSAQFISRYQFAPFDQYDGFLSNDGERIILKSATGDTLIDFTYNDADPWPELADGEGYSLVPVNADSITDLNLAENWRTSYQIHGSPGTPDNVVDKLDDRPGTALSDFTLFQNYPNPFNPETVISYQIPVSSDVQLSVYNLLGQKIVTLVNKKQQAGNYSVKWDASGFGSGVYFYRLETERGVTRIRKLVFIK